MPDGSVTNQRRDGKKSRIIQLSDYVKRMDRVEPKEMQWLWWPYIVGGGVTLLAGPPGVGKGLVSSSLAASVTRGDLWPDKKEKAPHGRVFWAETEDPHDSVLLPRLEAAGADMSRVRSLDLVGAAVEPDLGQIAGLIKGWVKNGLKLIVLSPLKSFLPKLKNANDELQVRKELNKLLEFITGTDCAILGLIHLNKKEDMSVLDRVGGSGAFGQVVRGCMGVGMEPGDEEARRLMNVKYSYGVPGDQLIFRPRHVGKHEKDAYVRAEWETATQRRDPQSLFQKQASPDGMSANDWLIAYLMEHGPTLKATVVQAYLAEGGKVKALEMAHSRGKEKGRFFGDVRGFPGEATWSLLEHQLAMAERV